MNEPTPISAEATPRVDAIPRRGPFHHYVVDDVLLEAKKLERELITLTRANEKLLEMERDIRVTVQAGDRPLAKEVADRIHHGFELQREVFALQREVEKLTKDRDAWQRSEAVCCGSYDKLLAENARIREERDELGKTLAAKRMANEQLQAENAELRKAMLEIATDETSADEAHSCDHLRIARIALNPAAK